MSRRQFRLYRKKRSLLKRIVVILIALLLFILSYLVFRGFLIRSLNVGSVSMEPTLLVGDRLLAAPLTYGAEVPFTKLRTRSLSSPKRGDLVIVRPPYYSTTPIRRLLSPFAEVFTLQRVSLEVPLGLDTEDNLLARRVVGLPGDTIRIENYEAFIRAPGSTSFISENEIGSERYSVVGDPLPEGWNESLPFGADIAEFVLEDEYFLMGDNRSITNDSRYWGALGSEAFVGKIVLRYWPLRSFGVPR